MADAICYTAGMGGDPQISKVAGLELKLLEILRCHSDNDSIPDDRGSTVRQTLSQKRIRELLKSEYHEEASDKAIRRALRVLLDIAPEVGCDVDELRRKLAPDGALVEENVLSDFFYEHPFTNDQLHFLVDTVRFSPYLTRQAKTELTEKLTDLASPRCGQKHLRPPETGVQANPEFFLTISVLDDAIMRDRKVMMKRLSRSPAGKRTVCLDAQGEEEVLVFSPYQFAMNAGGYWIIGNNERTDALAHYRIDCLCGAQIIEGTGRRWPQGTLLTPGSLEAEIGRYCRQHTSMHAGAPVRCTLRIPNALIPDVVDAFGNEAAFAEDEDGNLAVSFCAHPEDVLRFARIHLGSVQILSPGDLWQEMRTELKAALAAYGEASMPA